MTERYRTFPPRWAHVHVPTSTKEAALAGLTLYAPCRAVGRAVRRAAWTAVSVGGPALLPGRARFWDPPLPPDVWTGLLGRWREVIGGFDALAVYTRPQRERHGLALLLIAQGAPVGFVRLRTGARQSLIVEERVLRALAGTPECSFWAPVPRDAGEEGGWRYLLTTALPARLDRPPSAPDLRVVSADIQRALDGVLLAVDVPDHWTPMHGDLTPWNLREMPGLGLVLVDWEEAGWGPPHADEVLYRAAVAALTGGSVHPQPLEAVTYWQERVARRPPANAGRGFHNRLGKVLQRMREEARR